MGRGSRRYAVVVAAAMLGGQITNAFGSPEAVSCKLIRNVVQLQAINNNSTGNYCLANDIDASSANNFVPLTLSGKFFGNGYAIRNLTIDNSNANFVGLFGSAVDAVIQDVRLINVKITGMADAAFVGGLVGRMIGGVVLRVHVHGEIGCTSGCFAGGLVGVAFSGDPIISESSSSARVSVPTTAGPGYAGGAIAVLNTAAATATRVYATGPVSCEANVCYVGGLVGANVGLIDLSGATGPVSASNGGHAGGLVGHLLAGSIVRRSYALGAVNGGTSANAGGLIGTIDGATAEQSYAVGPVSGAGNVGGFFGDVPGTNTMADLYWDTQTSKQSMDLGDTTGRNTAQMRNALPSGFGSSWAITESLSYPFINDAQIDFTPPLATLVVKSRVFAFLPISQSEPSEYLTPPSHSDGAALATVYTMIARAIGLTRNMASLKFVGIDKYFWDDAAQTTSWAGPVIHRATLGALTAIPANKKLDGTNVIAALTAKQLVILRGTYKRRNGTAGTHWMLATLYTQTGGSVVGVVANDPHSGQQIMIDPQTKKVVSPANFPLTGFRVNGYRTVTVL